MTAERRGLAGGAGVPFSEVFVSLTKELTVIISRKIRVIMTVNSFVKDTNSSLNGTPAPPASPSSPMTSYF